MGFLTDYEEPVIDFQGKKYCLDLAYDTVLNVQRMYREALLDNADMLVENLRLFGISERDISRLTWRSRGDLAEQIYHEKIELRQRSRTGGKKLFDFDEDGEYIYASFRQAYGIDLIEEQGKLLWKPFVALFQGLPDGTKIREVMKIRGMEIPSYNGKNGKSIQEIMELKSYYALPAVGALEGKKMTLDTLFDSLERMASR